MARAEILNLILNYDPNLGTAYGVSRYDSLYC